MNAPCPSTAAMHTEKPCRWWLLQLQTTAFLTGSAEQRNITQAERVCSAGHIPCCVPLNCVVHCDLRLVVSCHTYCSCRRSSRHTLLPMQVVQVATTVCRCVTQQHCTVPAASSHSKPLLCACHHLLCACHLKWLCHLGDCDVVTQRRASHPRPQSYLTGP